MSNTLQRLWTLPARKRVAGGMSVEKNEALVFVRNLTEEGLLRLVIDRHHRLEDRAHAHRYVDTGHKRGNVVVTLD